MTQEKSTAHRATLKALMADDQEFLRELVREAMQQILEAEMTDSLGAEPGERTEGRRRTRYYLAPSRGAPAAPGV